MNTPHTDLPLDVVLSRLKEAADLPFDDACPMPPEVNHSRAFLERERSTIFTQEWICIGRADEMPNHGDYLTHDIAGVLSDCHARDHGLERQLEKPDREFHRKLSRAHGAWKNVRATRKTVGRLYHW